MCGHHTRWVIADVVSPQHAPACSSRHFPTLNLDTINPTIKHLATGYRHQKHTPYILEQVLSTLSTDFISGTKNNPDFWHIHTHFLPPKFASIRTLWRVELPVSDLTPVNQIWLQRHTTQSRCMCGGAVLCCFAGVQGYWDALQLGGSPHSDLAPGREDDCNETRRHDDAGEAWPADGLVNVHVQSG